MEQELLTQIIPHIPTYCWPIILVIILYNIINKQRKDTKETRDKDSSKLHDDVLSLKFKVTNLEGQSVAHDQIINDLREQISLLNTNLVRLSVLIERWDKNNGQ